MLLISIISEHWLSFLISIIVSSFLITLITRIITTAILKAKEEFYVKRFEKKESAARTGDQG